MAFDPRPVMLKRGWLKEWDEEPAIVLDVLAETVRKETVLYLSLWRLGKASKEVGVPRSKANAEIAWLDTFRGHLVNIAQERGLGAIEIGAEMLNDSEVVRGSDALVRLWADKGVEHYHRKMVERYEREGAYWFTMRWGGDWEFVESEDRRTINRMINWCWNNVQRHAKLGGVALYDGIVEG